MTIKSAIRLWTLNWGAYAKRGGILWNQKTIKTRFASIVVRKTEIGPRVSDFPQRRPSGEIAAGLDAVNHVRQARPLKVESRIARNAAERRRRHIEYCPFQPHDAVFWNDYWIVGGLSLNEHGAEVRGRISGGGI